MSINKRVWQKTCNSSWSEGLVHEVWADKKSTKIIGPSFLNESKLSRVPGLGAWWPVVLRKLVRTPCFVPARRLAPLGPRGPPVLSLDLETCEIHAYEFSLRDA